MKRIIKLISVMLMCLFVAFSFIACNNTCQEHTDSNHDGKCDKCNASVTYQHVDADNDGKCDECGKDMPKDECTNHVDANDDGKCDECGKDMPKDECTNHVDTDNDGKCDNCGTDMPKDECTNHVDTDNDGKCDNCGTDMPKDECTSHVDANDDGKCDNCGEPIIGWTEKKALKNIISNAFTETELTLSLKGSYNDLASGQAETISYELSFTKEGLDFITYPADLYIDENNYCRSTFCVRGTDVYRLDEYYSEAALSKTILQKVALPEELSIVKDYIGTAVDYIKASALGLVPEIDLSFLALTETTDGYKLSGSLDIGNELESVRQFLVANKDTSLYELLNGALNQLRPGMDIEGMIGFVGPLGAESIDDIFTLIEGLLMNSGMTLDSAIDNMCALVGVTATPEEFHALLLQILEYADIQITLPQPTEGQTLGKYIVDVCKTLGKGHTLNEIIALIANDETATLESVLTKFVALLKGTALKDFLSFIDFDYIQAISYGKFDFSLNLETDKNYIIKYVSVSHENSYTENEGLKGDKLSLEFKIEKREGITLRELDSTLLANNSVIKNVLDKLQGNFTFEISPDSFLTLFMPNISDFKIKVDGLNVDIGPIKSTENSKNIETYILLREGGIFSETIIYGEDASVESDTVNTLYQLDPQTYAILVKALSIVKNSSIYLRDIEQMIAQMIIITPDETGTTVTISLDITDMVNTVLNLIYNNADTPLLNLILSLVVSDPQSVTSLASIIKSIPSFFTLPLSTVLQLVPDSVFESISEILQITPDKAYELLRKLDENIVQPQNEETLSAYLKRALVSCQLLTEMTINDVLSTIFGVEDFTEWYNINIQPTINYLAGTTVEQALQSMLGDTFTIEALKSSITRFDKFVIMILINVDKENNLQYVQLNLDLILCYNFEFDGEVSEETLPLNLPLIKFSVKDVGNTTLKKLPQ